MNSFPGITVLRTSKEIRERVAQDDFKPLLGDDDFVQDWAHSIIAVSQSRQALNLSPKMLTFIAWLQGG